MLGPRNVAGVCSLLILMTACGGGGGGGSPGPAAAPVADGAGATGPVDIRAYQELPGDVLNPERGAFYWVDLLSGRSLGQLRGKGATLGFASVSLATYRTRPLDSLILDRLTSGFRTARMSGVKVILRFKYSSSLSEPDTTKAWILQHLSQLRPVFEANADVIAVLQAGFIGAWGEWHHSTNGLDNPVDQADILKALLQVLPSSRAVQVRTPSIKAQVFGEALLPESEAFTGTPRSRVGHHNDAFLASADDMGTYPSPVETWKSRVAHDGRFLPVGGETAALNPPRTDGPEAIREMSRLRWSFLSFSHYASVLSLWEQQGSTDEIRRRLGYRLRLIESSWTSAARPGGRLELSVRLRNDGFAPPFNERPLFVVLANEQTAMEAAVRTVDARRWEPGADVSFRVLLQLPAALPEGPYRLALRMPDAAPSLRAKPEYSIRFANAGVWDPGSGANLLTDTFRVDGGAPGTADPGAADFVQVP